MSTAFPHASTHVRFCSLLQHFSDTDIRVEEQGTVHVSAVRATPTTTASTPLPRSLSSTRLALDSTPAPISHEAQVRQSELRPFYSQVVKEVVTAFTGQQLCQRVLLCRNDTSAVSTRNSRMVASATLPPRANVQSALRRAMASFTQSVLRREEELMRASTACAAYLQAAPPGLSDDAMLQTRLFAALHHVPFRTWAGVHLYNGWCVRCTLPSPAVMEEHARKAAGAEKKRSGETRGRAVPFPSVSSLLATSSPKPLVLPSDIEAELQRYWKVHEEAAVRARLDALRNHDAEAFAEHVSLLKVSALLEIMEKTDAFMQRVGMRLQSQTLESNRGVHEAQSAVVRAPTAISDCVRSADSDYARFRAYVASTKNEFKLMHRVDVFVSAQPAGLDATLLPHQMDGLRFLASLHANGINGILADEMGVGKTVQTLAFLLYLKQTTDAAAKTTAADGSACAQRPHLVLAPLSVIREWQEACEQFVSTSLRVAVFQQLNEPAQEATQYDLVLLPVHAVRHVGAAAARVRWNYVVVDEAHKAVANLHTITAQAILALPCERRLVLTGTPLSSDLQELWSLLHFLNPAVFTDNDAFEEVFRRPFRVYDAKEMELTEEERGLLILRLHQVLRPFLLRRTKADIDSSLRRTLHRLWCPLTAVQHRLLALLRDEKRTPTVRGGESEAAETDSEGDAIGPDDVAGVAQDAAASGNHDSARGERHAELPQNALLVEMSARYLPQLASTCSSAALLSRIRADTALAMSSGCVSESTAQQLCNHAFLLPFFSQVLQRRGLEELVHESNTCEGKAGAAGMTLACSGKFLLLHLLLARLFAARHKVVLFTHWLSCVDLLSEYFQSRGWSGHVEVLTGSSSDAERKASVRRFRDDPACLFFVLSMKAGGCGINLQAAHMVVLLERDYTATNEDQALARVYRIGQRHTVRAVFLSTHDASEQRVAQRAEAKNRPRQAIIDDGVYQVVATEPDVKAEEVDSGDAGDAVCCDKEQVDEVTATDVHTETMWRLVSSVLSPCEGTAAPTATGSLTCNSASIEESSGSEQFWKALRALVETLDDLVLTDDDRTTEATPESALQTSDDCQSAGSAVDRLRCARPPENDAMLQLWLQRMEAARTAALVAAELPPSTANSPAAYPQRSAEGACAADVTRISHDDCTNEGVAKCGDDTVGAVGLRQPPSLQNGPSPSHDTPSPSLPGSTDAIPADPCHHPALFWLEFAVLMRLACQGPPALMTALDTAIENDVKASDPAVLLHRRRRRDRRAAKRLRLATIEVPDAFREKCGDRGVEDENTIAELYVQHLDQRRARQVKRGRE